MILGFSLRGWLLRGSLTEPVVDTEISMPRYSRKEILDSIVRFCRENGRPPKAKDFLNNPQYPSSPTVMKHFGRWNRALETAGIPPNRRVGYTRKEIIRLLRKQHEELGRTPTAKDFKARSQLPSPNTISQHFGKWNNALRAAGLTINNEQYSEETLIRAITGFHAEHGRPPNIRDFSHNPNYPSYALYRRKFGSLGQACIKLGLKPDLRSVTKRDVVGEFIKLSRRLKRTPMISDIQQGLGPLPRESVLRMFGRRFHDLVRAAGFKPVHKSWSDRELLCAIGALHKRIHRVPYAQDFAHHRDMPDPGLFSDRFGSFETALRRAGLRPTKDYELWRRWQRLVGEIAESLHGAYHKNRVEGIEGLVDFYFPGKRLIIDAMTTGYQHLQKESEIGRYLVPRHRLEFWCLHKMYEYKVPGLSYRYPDGIIRLVKKAPYIPGRKKNELIQRIKNKAEEELGFYTKKELIQILLDYVQVEGRNPTHRAFARNSKYPMPSTYKRLFGSWESALEEAGFATRKPLTKKQSIGIMQDMARRLGGVPRKRDCVGATRMSAHRICQPFGSWNSALDAARLKIRRHSTISKKLVVDKMKEFVRENGFVPEQRDWLNKPGYPSFASACGMFGSWQAAVRAAGYFPRRRLTRTELRSILRQAKQARSGKLTKADYLKMYVKNKGLNWPHPYTIERKLRARFDEIVRSV